MGEVRTVTRRGLNFLLEMLNKDPDSYRQEFEEQKIQYFQAVKVITISCDLDRNDLISLIEIISFISHACHHYADGRVDFVDSITWILRERGQTLHPELRMAFCKAVIVLRNRKVLSGMDALKLFFDLLRLRDKNLRTFVFSSTISHLRKVNSGRVDRREILQIEQFLFSQLENVQPIVVRIAELVLVHSFRKNLLNSAKVVNAIASCCFHKVTRIQVVAMKFFLGSAKDEEGLSDNSGDEDDAVENQKTIKEVTIAFKVSKKTNKKMKLFDKVKKTLIKENKKKRCSPHYNWTAIISLYDPQSFADNLFQLLESKKNEKFEIRLLQIALCARIIGSHKLQTLGFYSYLHRYLQPKQREVTRILLYAAQACHSLIPPDIVQQIIKVIVQNFVTDRNTSEAITVGINAVREIFINCPCAANQELLQDLTEYKNYKNKNVSMAARSLITLFRNVNPKLLHRKDRGRPTEATKEIEEPVFGKSIASTFVPGAECLTVEKNKACSPQNISVESDSDDYSSDFDDEMEHSDSDGEDLNDEMISGTQAVDNESQCSQNRSPGHAIDNENKSKSVDEISSRKSQAASICESKILSQSEFRKINAYNLSKRINNASRKQRNDDIELDEEMKEDFDRISKGDGLPRLKHIENFHKKIRPQSKEERMAVVLAGREGRGKYGVPKKTGEHVGRTNRELAKRKNYQMIKQKVRGKNRKRSFRDRQLSLKKYLMRQAGRKVV